MIEELLVLETREERRDGFTDAGVGRVRVGVRGMFRVRPWNRDVLWGDGAIGLVLLEASETRELVADFDDTMSKNVC